jgi:hypothetical protein
METFLLPRLLLAQLRNSGGNVKSVAMDGLKLETKGCPVEVAELVRDAH